MPEMLIRRCNCPRLPRLFPSVPAAPAGAMHIPIDKWLGTFATGKNKKSAALEEKIEVHISAEDEKKVN